MVGKNKLKFLQKNIDLTDLSKAFPNHNQPQWQRLFDVAYEWHSLALDLKNSIKREPTAVMYHRINIFAVGMSLELYVKSWASYNDPDFVPKHYKHRTLEIIEQYKSLEQFKNIVGNEELKNDIKMFQNIVNTKYGDTIVYEKNLDDLYLQLGELRDLISRTTKRGYMSKKLG